MSVFVAGCDFYVGRRRGKRTGTCQRIANANIAGCCQFQLITRRDRAVDSDVLSGGQFNRTALTCNRSIHRDGRSRFGRTVRVAREDHHATCVAGYAAIDRRGITALDIDLRFTGHVARLGVCSACLDIYPACLRRQTATDGNVVYSRHHDVVEGLGDTCYRDTVTRVDRKWAVRSGEVTIERAVSAAFNVDTGLGGDVTVLEVGTACCFHFDIGGFRFNIAVDRHVAGRLGSQPVIGGDLLADGDVFTSGEGDGSAIAVDNGIDIDRCTGFWRTVQVSCSDGNVAGIGCDAALDGRCIAAIEIDSGCCIDTAVDTEPCCGRHLDLAKRAGDSTEDICFSVARCRYVVVRTDIACQRKSAAGIGCNSAIGAGNIAVNGGCGSAGEADAGSSCNVSGLLIATPGIDSQRAIRGRRIAADRGVEAARERNVALSR